MLVAVGVIAGCSGQSDPCGSAAGAGIQVGDTAPALCGTTLDGKTVSLADLRGKPVVVNFWASWCVPCRSEFPLFKDELAKHPDLVILGVLFKDDPDPARSFVADFGAPWASLTDPSGAMSSAYRVTAAPASFMVDRGGVIRSRQYGPFTADDFERQYAAISK